MSDSHEIDRMVADLQAAGWIQKAVHVWQSPAGALHRGPAGAWRAMRGQSSELDRRDLEDGRAKVIWKALSTRVEIEQIFIDTEHWNRCHPNEEPIDADPDGLLRKICDGIDRMLAAEEARADDARGFQPIAPFLDEQTKAELKSELKPS